MTSITGSLDIISYLFTVAPVVGVMGWFIWLILKEKRTLQNLNEKLAEDYRHVADNAIKILTLVDDKISKEDQNSERVRDIHRMVLEIKHILEKK